MKGLIFVLGLLLMLSGQGIASGEECGSSEALDALFAREGVTGTMVIYDGEAGHCLAHNRSRAVERLYPASTFKIFHSLIALEYGVVKSADEVFYRYDGSPVFLESWKHDADLRYAIRVSQVPAYRKLARRIGPERMKKGLVALRYGNAEIGGNTDSFWLGGPLRISAWEQARLLYALAAKRLPFSERAQEEVIDITELEKGDGWSLHGKTGWATDNVDIPVGWFVGWVNRGGRMYSFALNMDLPDGKRLGDRERIVREALKALKLL